MKPDKRALIIEAARVVFSEYGYEKASMADIGARVGMNKASLYYHFRDKQALFAAMVEESRNDDERRQALEAAEPGPERIIAFLRHELGFVARLSLNFLEPTRQVAGEKPTEPVFSAIVAEDARILANLITEWPAFNPEAIGAGDLAAAILRVVQGLLLADCPLDLPRAEREAAYRRVSEQAETVISLMLRGAAR